MQASDGFLKCIAVIIGSSILGVLTAPAMAQTASAVLREDDALPGAPGETISSINNSAANRVGGYAFTVNSMGSGTTLSHIWGDAAGGAGTVIRTEGTFGGLMQTSYESFYGLSNAGQAAYSASSTRLSDGTTGLDGVWVDDNVILNEEDGVGSLPGFFSTFNSRPGITANGTPYWVGGISDTQGGSTQNRVLFFGNSANAVLKGGDNIGGVSEPIETGSSNIDFDVRYSALGTAYITQVLVDTGSNTNDGVVVSNGNAVSAGGGIIREASPVPASVGGLPGENYDNFDFFGINESGNFMVTGDTDASTSQDEYVMLNGQIVLREGDLASGLPISGAIEGGYMNEGGDWAVIWDVDGPAGNVEALIFNGETVLLEGDTVDWNNDGIIDASDNNGVLANFTGISALTLGESDMMGQLEIYFTADIDFNGTSSSSDDLEGGFRITVPEPGTLLLLMAAIPAMLRRRR